MDDVRIGKEMYQKAIDFMDYRYGINKSGGVAVLRIETGEYLISVWDEEINESAYLCAEVGAICEAHKLNKKVTHSLCVCRQNDGEDSKILSPCGICQERLFYWGNDVKCAITNDSNDIIFKSLKELQPYYWNK